MAPEELKVTSINSITLLSNKFDFQIYLINIVGYKYYLKDLDIEYFIILIDRLDYTIAIY